jgi:hypothetical protein
MNWVSFGSRGYTTNATLAILNGYTPTFVFTGGGSSISTSSNAANVIVSGAITATNGFVWPKTNAAPTGVTWGVTAPDYWVTNTVQGVLVLMPCWINR